MLFVAGWTSQLCVAVLEQDSAQRANAGQCLLASRAAGITYVVILLFVRSVAIFAIIIAAKRGRYKGDDFVVSFVMQKTIL